jgi:sodium-coupled neutral amino acid transporter 11
VSLIAQFVIVIGDSIPVLFEQYFPDIPILANRAFVISVISWVFVRICSSMVSVHVFLLRHSSNMKNSLQIFPLHLSRSIGTIANWSIVSVLLLPVILLTVIIRCPAYASQHSSPITVVGPDVFGSLGIMAFAFGCAQVPGTCFILWRYVHPGMLTHFFFYFL